VVVNIGGYMSTERTVEEGKPVYAIIPKAQQQEAMRFLQEQLFTTPTWLLNNDIQFKAATADWRILMTAQDRILGNLLAPAKIGNLLHFATVEPVNAYTATDMLNELKAGIWSELKTHKNIDVYRRNLQKAYVERLVELVAPPESRATATAGVRAPRLSERTDAVSLVKAHTKQLAAEIKAAITATTDVQTKMHLADVYERLDKALNP